MLCHLILKDCTGYLPSYGMVNTDNLGSHFDTNIRSDRSDGGSASDTFYNRDVTVCVATYERVNRRRLREIPRILHLLGKLENRLRIFESAYVQLDIADFGSVKSRLWIIYAIG